MSTLVNWFRIKFDRNTHDAKFQVFTGASHQEINLQVQAELNKTTRTLNEYIRRCEDLRTENKRLRQELEAKRPNSLDRYDKYFSITSPECKVARLSLCYSEHETLLDATENTGAYNARVSTISLLDTNDAETIREFIMELIKNALSPQNIHYLINEYKSEQGTLQKHN